MVAATLAVAGCCVSTGTAIADPPAPPPPAPPAPPAPATTMDHDGTYTVGSDIVPGAYGSAGPVGNGTCYWKRVSRTGDIIDNALTKKAQVVQIDANDASFKTSGCQPWQITDAPPPAPLSPLAALGQLGGFLSTINSAPQPHP